MGRYSCQPGPFAKNQLSLDEYKELRAYADERGVSLSCIKDTYADPVVVRALVDAAHNVITTEGFEFLGNHGKNRLTIEQWSSSKDFGMTKENVPHIIYVNKNLMENAEEFAKAYAKEVEDGWFVAGTTYEAVIYHEMGHIYQTRKGFSPIRIARKMFGTKDWGTIKGKLEKQLSRYAGFRSNGCEISAEAFSGFFSGVGNDVADRFMDEARRV